jgi:hypothetical protein
MLVVASSRTSGSPGTGGSSRESTPPPVVDHLYRDTHGHDDRDASPPCVDMQIGDAVVELGLGEVDPRPVLGVLAHDPTSCQDVPQRGHRPNSSTV